MKKHTLFLLLTLSLSLSAADTNDDNDTPDLRIGDLFTTVFEGWRLEPSNGDICHIGRRGLEEIGPYKTVETGNPDDQYIGALIIIGLRKGSKYTNEPGTPIACTSEGKFAFLGEENNNVIKKIWNNLIGDPTEVIFLTTDLEKCDELEESRMPTKNSPHKDALIPADAESCVPQNDICGRMPAGLPYIPNGVCGRQPNGSPYIFCREFISSEAGKLKNILSQYQKVIESKTKSSGKR